MKILIVEDEEPIRETLQCLLELNGHTVLAAADGRAGVKLAESRPDLILSDIGLPGIDGFEMMAAIQQKPICRDVPFIFLTARADRADQRRGMALGADDYITKPFTERDILDAINARIRRQQPLRERVTQLLAQHNKEIGANWSHELMTPLVGILGGLEMIEEEADTIQSAELRELLALIRAGAKRQQVLAQKLVLYYELESIKSSPRTGSCAVSEAILAAIDRVNQIERREENLTVDCDSAEVKVGERYLVTAMGELIGNALRFSKPGQPVHIKGRREANGYLIEIVDEGPGMTASECAGIGPFIQFGRDKREQQGLGLGLAIIRSVAEIGGGRLELTPGDNGRGLRARMELACG